MTTLVLGASGATGKLLVAQLLEQQQKVKAIVRSVEKVPAAWKALANLQLIEGSISSMQLADVAIHLQGCDAVACCLGHNLSLKGIYGKPQKLVRNAIRLVCDAVVLNAAAHPTKIVLMNTAGNRNRALAEPISLSERLLISLLRLLLPPHPDNEKAADHLRVLVGQSNPEIAWVVVRPDTLIDQAAISPYDVHTSPTRSALFNPGKTSRINVAHFMARLLLEAELWVQWRGKMPVIYNREA
ncbi:MAG: NAD(P)-dependent oxidoreductase [Bacteroidia bacterium]